jgi:Uma2 family endonuclease
MGRDALNEPPAEKMTREEFRAWAAAQPRGRFERVGGEVVAMGPERLLHVRVKYAVWQALTRAVQAAASPCEVLGDGATVAIDADTDYEPDAVVNCGPRADGTLLAVPNPVIVVEVQSTSTRHVDTGIKLIDYFRVPSIQHYLIVRVDRRAVLHHRRVADRVETTIVPSGTFELDPPGLHLDLAAFYET